MPKTRSALNTSLSFTRLAGLSIILSMRAAFASECDIPSHAHLDVVGQQSTNGKPSEAVELDIVRGTQIEVHSFDRVGRVDVTLKYQDLLPISGLNSVSGAKLRYKYSVITGDINSLDIGAHSEYRRLFTVNDELAGDDTVSRKVVGLRQLDLAGCSVATIEIATVSTSNMSDRSDVGIHWYSTEIGYDAKNHIKSCVGSECSTYEFNITKFAVK